MRSFWEKREDAEMTVFCTNKNQNIAKRQAIEESNLQNYLITQNCWFKDKP